jgi:hypothetical protein
MSVPDTEVREEPSPDSSDNRIFWRQHPLFRSARYSGLQSAVALFSGVNSG